MSWSNRPPALPSHDIWSLLAVAYPFGLAPKAPGTFGSLPGLVLGVAFASWSQELASFFPAARWLSLAVLLSASTAFAWLVIDRTETRWQTHDDGRIVIDEVLGQAIPIAFLGWSATTLILSFIIFRWLDIVKPGPIGWCDRELPGAWGTLLDDVLAGICTLPLVFALSSLLRLAL